MERWTRRARVGGVLIALAAVAIFGLNLIPAEDTADRVEITEYEGAKLGSVSDFRENSIRGVQDIDISTYTLAVDGLVSTPVSLDYDAVQTMEHVDKLVTIHCVEGWSVQALWSGVRLADLFDLAVPTEDANTVIFHAADGYTTSLPLEVVLERNLILADHINGITLPPANGFPFQLVAEDKWGYKWIRWVTRIELSSDSDYHGYWESIGYSNDATVGEPMFGR